MLPENPEKEIQELQAVLNLMVQGLTDPVIARKLQEEGKTINLSPIVENLLLRLKIRDPEVFRNIRPEESQGFASVAELQAAEQNVATLKQGSPEIPSPPEPGQDHQTRIGAYLSMQQLMQENQELVDALQVLIFKHQQLLEEESNKSAPRSGSTLKKPRYLQSSGHSKRSRRFHFNNEFWNSNNCKSI